MKPHKSATVLLILSSLGYPTPGQPATQGYEHEPRVAYMLHCGGCHLADGRGVPPEVPGLRDELGQIVQVPDGREYLVRVPGAAQSPIGDAELAAIINYILVTFNAATLPDGFEQLSTAEVAAARRSPLADPGPTRSLLWQRHLDMTKPSTRRSQAQQN